MSDTELSKKIEEYSKLASEDPNVDINTLMMNALEAEHKKASEKKSYRMAYLISVGAPPFGLLFAVKYFMSGEEKDKNAAFACLILTALSIIFLVGLTKLFFSSSGTSLNQIQQIKPSDINELVQ